MLQINVHCHKRVTELEKLLISLIDQELDFRPKLNIILDPLTTGLSEDILFLLDNYRESLGCKYEVCIYTFSKNVGLASAIINGLRKLANFNGPTVILEDDIVLLDNTVIRNVQSLFSSGFAGHVNLWQPIGFSSTELISYGKYMWCWGWAIDHETLQKFLETTELRLHVSDIYEMGCWGFDFINHLMVNISGDKKTWAIFYFIFILVTKCAVYNFKVAKTAEVSTFGTNRKSSIFRRVITATNNFLARSVLIVPLHPNTRYKLMFTLNLLAPYRIVRSLVQIALHKRQIKCVSVCVDEHDLIVLKR